MIRVVVTLLGMAAGASAGFAVPALVLLTLSKLYEWRGGDETAAGVFSFCMIPLAPLGVLMGAILGFVSVQGWYESRANKPGARPVSQSE